MVGFTRISSKLESKILIDELNEIFTAFDDIMEFNDCDRIKTIGDAYLAVGGMTEKSKNHAYKIVRAATQMIEYLKKRNQTSPISWTIRVGIHSGSLVGGVVGVKKYIYDVFGDTVNTASRMETNSEEMKINISDVTYQLVKNDFTFIERETTEIKGKDLMKMWFVVTNSID
ncbi:MAG: adenylate/guanylate cyclase domain-containing protein [Spirochaetales bacterium]|nr:adenylate/guanylate cyclase domain-containing protein [Spirochaetales bacterium]